MKIRAGFVSNSSSCSFLVLSDNSKTWLEPNWGKVLTITNEDGESEFGWQNVKYHDFYSKAIFAYLLAQGLPTGSQRADALFVLDRTIKNNSKVDTIEWEINLYKAYIDHGSTIEERPENGKIFKSEEKMRLFLFNDSSYIQNCNDNE